MAENYGFTHSPSTLLASNIAAIQLNSLSQMPSQTKKTETYMDPCHP